MPSETTRGAGSIAALYGEPELVPVMRVLSLQFLLLIFETLPQSDLERNIAAYLDRAGRRVQKSAWIDASTKGLSAMTTPAAWVDA